jgi:hypothetical protein
MGPGARFELMFDIPRDPRANVRLDARGDAGEEDHPFIAIASEGELAAPPMSRSSPTIRENRPANRRFPNIASAGSAPGCRSYEALLVGTRL